MNKEALLLEGGINGIQLISKGGQQFATENNFLFFTNGNSNKSFQVKTYGGILLENKKNKINLRENGLNIEANSAEINIIGELKYEISGDYYFKFTENRLNYNLEMHNGKMNISNFSSYNLIGELVNIDVTKLLIKKGEYGLDWEDDLLISNANRIKLMSLNGDLIFSTKNGERILFENEKQNGSLIFKGEKGFINTNILKIDNNKFYLDSELIKINKNINLENNILDINVDDIKIDAKQIAFGNIKIKDKNIIIQNEKSKFEVTSDKISINNGDESNFEVTSDKISINNTEKSMIEITKDKISIIGDGDFGIIVRGEKGGIKMLGDLQWIHMENKLIETDQDTKILKLGNKDWKILLENCYIDGKMERRSSNFLEIMDNNSIHWINKENNIFLDNEKIEIMNDSNIFRMNNNIEIKSKNMILDVEKFEENGKNKIMIWENIKSIIKEKYELIFGEDNGIIYDGEKLEIKGVLIKQGEKLEIKGVLTKDERKLEIKGVFKYKDNLLLIGNKKNYMIIGDNMIIGNNKKNIIINENNIIIGNIGNIGNNIEVNKNNIIIGNKKNYININESVNIIIGNNKNNIEINEGNIRMNIGCESNGNNNKFIIEDGNSIWENNGNIRIKSKKLSIFGDIINLDGKINKINGDAICIGNNDTNIVELICKKIMYKNQDTLLEIDNSFLYKGEKGKLHIGEKGFNIESSENDFNIIGNIKGKIDWIASRNINIESTIGDIYFKSNTSRIYLDGISKKLSIESDGDILLKGKLIIDSTKVEIMSNNILIEIKHDFDIRFGRKLEIIGKEIEIQTSEKLKWHSDKFGEFILSEDSALDINKSFELCIGENYNKKVGGKGLMIFEENLEIKSNKNAMIFGEESLIFITNRDLIINSKESLNIDTKKINIKVDDIDGKIRNIEFIGNEMNIEMKQIRMSQKGFGEMNWDIEGKFQIISKIEGNRGDVMELISESNTHDKSIHIYSRMGGIYLEGHKIGLAGGKVLINGVELVGAENKLSVGGIMEVHGLKIGKNMFIEPKGISLLQREEIEFRNMDIKIGGRIDAESLRVKKILGGKEVEGKMRVIGGIECKGGIVGDGFRVGNWDGGNRSCLKIELNGTIWNEGVNISGGGRSIVVDGDIVCGGGGRILANCPREGRESGGGRDITKLLEEVAAMGESGMWDVGRALQKLAAIVGILAADNKE